MTTETLPRDLANAQHSKNCRCFASRDAANAPAGAPKTTAADNAVQPRAATDLSQDKTSNNFARLVQALKDVLGPSSGFDSSDVNVDKIKQLMEGYVSNDKEWGQYNMGNSSMGYTRNLVDTGNGKSNLTGAEKKLVIVWSPKQGSPIHDHGAAHCIMKILKGNLTETRYDWPENGANGQEMQIKTEKVLGENQVAYMNDDLGLHRMSNPGSDFAVSLHLYSPPYVARRGCHIFDENSGKKTHAKCGYYSKFGQRVQE